MGHVYWQRGSTEYSGYPARRYSNYLFPHKIKLHEVVFFAYFRCIGASVPVEAVPCDAGVEERK